MSLNRTLHHNILQECHTCEGSGIDQRAGRLRIELENVELDTTGVALVGNTAYIDTLYIYIYIYI